MIDKFDKLLSTLLVINRLKLQENNTYITKIQLVVKYYYNSLSNY